MKPSTVPMICGVALAAMSTAGLSHWWSARRFAEAVSQGLPLRPSAALLPAARPAPLPMLAAAGPPNKSAPAPSAGQKEFFETLIKEVKTLRNENLNLVDQMAETNRDLMKLEFRVDTHSESFRPLPVNDERPDTSFDDGPGVLPPRAEPVFPFSDE